MTEKGDPVFYLCGTLVSSESLIGTSPHAPLNLLNKVLRRGLSGLCSLFWASLGTISLGG